MEFQKNQICQVTIEDIGSEGEGIGKIDGFPLFIKDTVAGDVVTARITKAKKNYAFARLEEILTPSPDRVTPPCPCFRQCGGCQLQPLSYEKQLAFKADKVRNDLQRIGGFAPDLLGQILEPIVGMQEPWHYRNKAQYPFGKDRNGNAITGFYAGRTHSIIAHTDCLLGAKENQAILQAVLDYLQETHTLPYDEETGKGLLRHTLIRKSRKTGHLMVCLILNGRKLPAQEILLQKLQRIPQVSSVSLNVNTEKTNVILGKETHTIWGEDSIEDALRLWEKLPDAAVEAGNNASGDSEGNTPGTSEGDAFPGYRLTEQEITYRISPNSFYQVNPVQTQKLYSLALEFAQLTGQETVWDLYCGIGTISLFLARHAKQVYGVEIVPQAIEDAQKNAADNALTNTEFFTGSAEEVLPAWYAKTGIRPDVIVVDPPRKGCDEKCLQTMLEMEPERIVYVSCDPATLSRDLKILCAQKYALTRVRPVDLFPMTVHVETVVLMSRVENQP